MVESVRRNELTRGDIRHGDLAALSRLVGTGYGAMGRALDGRATVAKGVFDLRQIRPGLLVHASDARHERTLTTRLVKHRSINFSIVLQGGWQATLGGTSLACGDAEPRAMAFVLSEADLWQKQALRGGYARMVNVMASPEWLENSGMDGSELSALLVGALSRRHRWQGQWKPSSRLVALASRILGRPLYIGALQRLHLESRAIDIVVESLALLTDAATGGARSPGDHWRMRLVRERLDDGVGRLPSLTDLAREAGVSARTLQRQFADVHGVGVLEYVRRRRLDLARVLLERDGVTVAQAAYSAGYAHAANFATAFRRQFGVLPSQVRARV